MPLNPSSPVKVGPEWRATRRRAIRVDASAPRAITFPLAGAVDVDRAAVAVGSVIGAPAVSVSIIPTADFGAGSILETIYRPNVDEDVGALHATAGGGTPFYSRIDEAVLDVADYIADNSVLSGDAHFNAATGGFAAGQRIFDLTVGAVVRMSNASDSAVVTPQLKKVSGGVEYPADEAFAIVNASQAIAGVWTRNPETGLEWTVAAVQAFAAAWAFGFGWEKTGNGSVVRGEQLWLAVHHQPENRIVVGSWVPVVGENVIDLDTPAAVDEAALAAEDHALVFVVEGSGSFTLKALDTADETGHPDGFASAPVELVDGRPDSIGTAETVAPYFVLLDDADVAVAGQGYVTVDEVAVNADQSIRQAITLPDTDERGYAEIVVRQGSVLTSAPLVLRLRRTSDDVQIGGTVTITPHELRAKPRILQVVGLPATAAAAGTAAEHYIEATSTAVAPDDWQVACLVAGENGADLTFGGDTLAATIDGVEHLDRDLLVLWGRSIDAPVDLDGEEA